MTKKHTINEQETKTKEFLTNQTKTAVKLRSKETEFHGLEREFLLYQQEMLANYASSKDVKHPRDVGDIREDILKKFIKEKGLIPYKYGISEGRVRVASTSGHLSNEMDIVFYDRDNNIKLMNRSGIYEVFPVETVYGIVQVKSKLTKKELINGLNNIASFKKLNRAPQNAPKLIIGKPKEERGFGILFAYDTDMEWSNIIKEISYFSKNNPSKTWTNFIVILNHGIITHGTSKIITNINSILEKIDKNNVVIHGNPDRNSSSLYYFYDYLINSLNNTESTFLDILKYHNLPLTAGDLSYTFTYGHFVEMLDCKKHGAFLKKFTQESLNSILTYCKNNLSTNMGAILNLSGSLPIEVEKLYSQAIWVYNPDVKELKDIMFYTNGALAYDSIECDGKTILIPHYYAYKMYECPKCSKKSKKTS